MHDLEYNMYRSIYDYLAYILGSSPSDTPVIPTETAISFLTPHIGTPEYTGIVAEIQTWYYGSLVKAAWCATCASYILTNVYHYKCHYENVYHLNSWAAKNLTPIPDLQSAKENDLVIIDYAQTFGVTSKKHCTFFTGSRDMNGNLMCLGGNQSDSIRISAYPPSHIHAVYRPHYQKEV